MPLPERRRETTLKIEGTHIMFRPNFAGEEGKFNREGERFFNVAIPSEEVDQLREAGWNIKEWGGKEEGDEIAHYLKVNVSFRFKPPRMVLITSRGRVPLDEETCDMLDWTEYDFIDVIVSGSYYNVNGRSGISGYLKTGMFVVHEDELEQKYAHLPEVGMDPILALPPGEEPGVEILDDSGWQVDEDGATRLVIEA